ncbi:MAG TPA: hypothetical protein VKD69_26915 [Vicinamibacterales bacterium]|nr:hypothetical protein [Vicinamibacterales bacterium]
MDVVAAAVATLAGSAAAQQQEPGSPRARAPLTFLRINDVYSTVPIDASAAWRGWRRSSVSSRRRAVRRCWYSPAISSRRRSHRAFKGARMIAALNAAGLDLATLGNHEFDFGDDLPIERTREAKWQWVISNVVDTRTGRPIGGAP